MIPLAYIGPGPGWLLQGPAPFVLLALLLIAAWCVARSGKRHGMLSMSDTQFERWERRRRHGALYFIVVHGVIVWGVTTAVLASLFSSLFLPNAVFFDQLRHSLVAFPIAGVAYGSFGWAWGEHLRRRRSTKHAG